MQPQKKKCTLYYLQRRSWIWSWARNLLIFGQIFQLSSYHDSTKGSIQNNFHHKMGCVCMVSIAFQIEKHATNLPTNCKFSFQRIFGVFMKPFLNDLKIHIVKLQLCFDKCQEFGISFNLEKCLFMVFSGVILR